MTTERRAFKPLFKMISDGNITEKEAYDIACGIFSVTIQYVPAPYIPEENPAPEQSKEIEVKGFINKEE